MHPLASGSFAPNAWGLYDMNGERYGMVPRHWYARYPVNQVTNPVGPRTGIFRIARGGALYDNAANCTSTYRSFDRLEYRDYGTALRLAINDFK